MKPVHTSFYRQPLARTRQWLMLFITLCAAGVSAESFDDESALMLQKQWDQITYATPKARQEAAYEALAARADVQARLHPRAAEVLLWQGIIYSTWAGARGGFGALSLAKKSRDALARCIAIDGTVRQGNSYTSLGALYYQVPGWPVSFGDNATARKLLVQGLAFDPDGVDANYFYGDFLRATGERAQAIKVLERALHAPTRPGRELADAGRRREVSALLADLNKKG